MTAHCCFCGEPLPFATVRNGQRIPQRWCNACKARYDRELGPGWEHTEWATFLAADQRRLDRQEEAEAAFVRLDAPGAHALSADDLAERPRDLLDDVRQLWQLHGYGSRLLQRDLARLGWRVGRTKVWQLLRQVKQEGARAA